MNSNKTSHIYSKQRANENTHAPSCVENLIMFVRQDATDLTRFTFYISPASGEPEGTIGRIEIGTRIGEINEKKLKMICDLEFGEVRYRVVHDNVLMTMRYSPLGYRNTSAGDTISLLEGKGIASKVEEEILSHLARTFGEDTILQYPNPTTSRKRMLKKQRRSRHKETVGAALRKINTYIAKKET